MDASRPLLVVTDLDGTLLDHHDYRFNAARPALARLVGAGVPVVLNTSKTRAELAPLQQQLGLTAPFVVENGAAIHWPTGTFPFLDNSAEVLGTPRARLLKVIDTCRQDFTPPLEGFADWDVATLVAHTGLSPADAELALAREYSEPLLWRQDDAAFDRLARTLANRGLQLVRGGRFVHVNGGGDKGEALEWLRGAYQRLWGKRPYVVALGDGGNDVPMLERADCPVVIPSPVNPAPKLSKAAQQRCIVAPAIGPEGWNRVLIKLLEQPAAFDTDTPRSTYG